MFSGLLWLAFVLAILVSVGLVLRAVQLTGAPFPERLEAAFQQSMHAAMYWLGRIRFAALSWLRVSRRGPFVEDFAAAGPRAESAVPVPRRAARTPAGVTADPAGAPLTVAAGDLPPVWGPVISHIRNFDPEDDNAIREFVRGLAAGEVATAEALRGAFQNCVNGTGLDPASVYGLAEYADVKADSAHDAAMVWHGFRTYFAEVKEWIASGGTLPNDGKFLTGDS